MKKEEECDKENQKNNNDNYELKDKSSDIKGQKILNDIDNDKETDDILIKLGNLSKNSDDKSFDSPIIFNRTKTFYNEFKTESRKILYESFITNNNINNSILNNAYKSRNKTIKKVFRPKSLINIKMDSKNKNISNFKKELERFTINEDIPEMIRKNSNNNFKVNYSNLERIKENIVNDKIDKNKIETIDKKVDNINILIKEIKQIDKTLKKKDLNKILNNFISKNSNININSIYDSLNEFLDYIIGILNSIQNNIQKSNNKIGNEKIILNLQKELKEKDKEIGEIINKMNLEKQKSENNFKSNSTEIINLKKQNKDLINKLSNAEKHISKLELNNEILEEKINQSILEKNNKIINSSTSIRSSFINNTFYKKEPPSLETSYITAKSGIQSEIIKNNNQKINDKYNSSKKLNLNLIDLLKEINNNLCYYDSFLNKEFGVNKNMQNLAKNLINFLDINGLNEEKKMKAFTNEFMRNMDIVFKKIEEYIKETNKNKDNKHNNNVRYLSTKLIPKKGKNSSINKENNINNLDSRNWNIVNMTKNLQNTSTMNINIPTRKRTKTINNPTNKDSV